MTGPRLEVAIESWPLSQPFVIARGAKTEARVVVATLTRDGFTGRGECVPYARYGETPEAVADTLAAVDPATRREDLARVLAPGAARNALDCALWDWQAKATHRRVAVLAAPDAGAPAPLLTCYTLSLGTPDAMAAAARAASHLKLLKLKLGGAGDHERMEAVRASRPDARLVADANEAWTPDMVVPFLAAARAARIELIEQPLPAGSDGILGTIDHGVPICADESAHTSADIARLAKLYDAVNIKLDKAGGLTEALAMRRAARAAGLKVMAGCMVATSLAMAPAFVLAQDADWADLDGPLLLARDREHGLRIEDGVIAVPAPELWG